MNLILFGPPGAGKGTQSDYLVSDLKLFKVSAGDLLRKEIDQSTDLGNEIKATVDQGKFVSDKIINSLVEKIVSNNQNANKMIFDGYPRNIDQAKNLDFLLKKNNQKLSCVLNLNVEKNLIIKRILGRQICTNCGLIFNKFFNPSTKKNHSCEDKNLITRADDNEPTIISRFNTYIKETLPIIKYYQKQNLVKEVNGMNEIDQIYKEIQVILSSLETWLCEM